MPAAAVAAARVLLVDARAPFGSGLGRYCREVVRALHRQHAFDEIVLAGDPAELQPFLRTLRAPLRVIPLGAGRHSPRVPLGWPAIAAQVGRPHVTWFPNWDGAWRTPHAVATIHDLINLQGGDWRATLRAAVARAWIQRIVRGSARLLTVSEQSAREIVAAFPEAAGKLTVVPNGVADYFHDFGAKRSVGAARGARDAGASNDAGASHGAAPFLLTVANKRPHKRLETAIRAFAQMAAEHPSLRLVMVGDRTPHATVLESLAASLGVADRIDDREGLNDEQLAMLYGSAEALLVPSREEGFGLVALEAMACGCPVVAVDRPILREVLGDAAEFVPFDDATAMAAAVRRLSGPDGLRDRLITSGRARAADYTWTRTAERIAGVLQGA